MRIIETLKTVDPKYGGPTESVRQISGLLRTHCGVDLEVLTLDDPSSPYVEEFPLKVHAMGPGRGVYGYSARYTKWLEENLHSYDCVVINGIWGYQSYGAYRAIRKVGKPYFVFTHGMLDPFFQSSFLKKLKKSVYWNLFEKHCVQNATAVMFTCEEECRLAHLSFPGFHCNPQVTRWGTADPNVDLEACKREFLAAHPELADKRMLFFISRLDAKKGIDLLIRAAAKTPDPSGKVVYVIAGPDTAGLQSGLMSLSQELGVANRVFWPGMLTGAMKWGAFAASEALIFPSHQENFGLVVAEALACKKPVLTTDKVNIWHEVANYRAGFVENDDEAGIETLLRKWFALTEAEREEMGTSARLCFEREFEAKRAAEFVYEVYRTRTASACVRGAMPA